MREHGYLAIAVWLIVIALSVTLILFTRVSTDMTAFLPRTPERAQQVLVDQLRDGVASRLILVGLDGADLPALAEASRAISAKLQERPEFASVANGAALIGEADRSYLWRYRFLLSGISEGDGLSVTALHRALESDVMLLRSSLEPLIKEGVRGDPTGETIALARRLAWGGSPTTRQGVWTSRDGNRALILVQTRAPGFDVDAQQTALAAIDDAAVSARQSISGAAGLRYVATGPGVFAVETRARIKHDVTLYSILGSATIILLLWLFYQSITPLVLTLMPVISGSLVGFAAVDLAFGFVHGITIGFGITLIGESVDYAVYLFGQTAPDSRPGRTLARIWPTLRLGVAVSICGFATMLFSSFTGFAQLGVFTIAGLITAIAVTRWVLPALVPDRAIRASAFATSDRMTAFVLGSRRMKPVLAGVFAAAMAIVLTRQSTVWQTDLAQISPIPAADQALDRALRQDLGAPDVRWLIVAEGATAEAVLQTAERLGGVLDPLIERKALAGYDSPTRFLPSVARQQARQALLPERQELGARMTAALAGTPFKADAFEPFLDGVDAAKREPPITRATLGENALSLKIDSLLVKRRGGAAVILPLQGVSDVPAIEQAVAGLADGGVTLIDAKAESDKLLGNYERESVILAVLGGLSIVVLLLVSLRSVRRTMTIIAPLTVSVVFVLALIEASGHKLSIFNLFGLLLVVAVGSNYCLFFEAERLDGADGARTIRSLVLANLCTVIGFGALSLSAIPVLHDLGITVALGTALTLAAAAILAPAAPAGATLAGPARLGIR